MDFLIDALDKIDDRQLKIIHLFVKGLMKGLKNRSVLFLFQLSNNIHQSGGVSQYEVKNRLYDFIIYYSLIVFCDEFSGMYLL